MPLRLCESARSMATVTLDGVGKDHGKAQILGSLSFEIADGELLVLVGPSGCGKSTLLRCIAGLDELSRGRILVDGRDVTQAAPRDRDLAMVFQNYALYPHLTVRENLAFGLKMRKMPAAEIAQRVNDVALLLGLETLLERTPQKLSGGQCQRVAIGRALVRTPKAFLFDEPLSNLDAALRTQMRVELKRLHQRLGATMIYVTHDQVEAMTLADRIAVLRQGVLQQLGTPTELYERPNNLFVARFLGTPEINVVDGKELMQKQFMATLPDRAVKVGIRPESIHFVADGKPARVDLLEQLGWESLVHLDCDGVRLVARVSANAPTVGATVGFKIDDRALHYFDRDEKRL